MEPPRIQARETFLVAGTVARYDNQKIEGIPAQWDRFAPQLGKIPGQIGWTTYGVCFGFDGNGNFDYMCGVEVPAPPPGLALLQIAEQKYAVFTHRGHISTIKATWDAIFRDWLPSSGHKMLDAPQFELYSEDFDPQAGTGCVEIWIPIE